MMQIEIDQLKCKSTHGCVKCLQSCPEGVLWTYPRDRRAPGRAAANWVVVPVMKTQCTGCLLCEKACPESALSVSAVA